MVIVAREPRSEEGFGLYIDDIAWFDSFRQFDEVERVEMLTTDCVLRYQVLSSLKKQGTPFNLVREAATVVSLRDVP